MSLCYLSDQSLTANFDFPNGRSVNESSGSFLVCVELNEAPLIDIAITVDARGVNTEGLLNTINAGF